MTKQQVTAYNKKYREEHREEIKEKSREYNLKNQVKRKEWYVAWFEQNKDKVRAKNREWYKNNKDKGTNWDLKKNYGIGLEDYQLIFQSQNGLCAICRSKPKENRRLSVDHSHETGRVRGLLCDKCNFALGHFNDNIEFLLRAINYLKT